MLQTYDLRKAELEMVKRFEQAAEKSERYLADLYRKYIKRVHEEAVRGKRQYADYYSVVLWVEEIVHPLLDSALDKARETARKWREEIYAKYKRRIAEAGL